jgi:DNA-binding Lrp family transcriptional regulator
LPKRQGKRADRKRLDTRVQGYNGESKENPLRVNQRNILGKDPKLKEEKSSNVALDNINICILEALVNDADIKSSDISKKIKIPLSTVQRRRARIEKSILKKKYQMDLTLLGYRTGHIFIEVKGGKAKETGEELLKRYDRNVVNASTRINSNNNLCLEVIYNDSEELHYLLEEIKALPVASKVEWSELVVMLGDNMSKILKNTLGDRLEKL